MQTSKGLCLFVLLVLSLSLSAQTTKKINIWVGPQMELENYEHFRRLVLMSSVSAVNYIDGFQFDWGYSYVLEVAETRLTERLSDGTLYEYKLMRVLSKEKSPRQLEFSLRISSKIQYQQEHVLVETLPKKKNGCPYYQCEVLTQVNDSVYRYMDRVEIEIPSELHCTFQELIKNSQIRTGRFAYVSKKRIRLRGF